MNAVSPVCTPDVQVKLSYNNKRMIIARNYLAR